MNDRDCISLLQWALPRLGHRWRGYRQVRRQVCRRIDARIKFLGLANAAAYRQRLESHSAEWTELLACLPVTISRFFRDRGVFQTLADTVLPALAQSAQQRGAHTLRAWSAGCASGEEAYSLSMLWVFQLQEHHPGLVLSVLATDVDAAVLDRARAACYQASSLRELDAAWREKAFTRENDRYCLRPSLRACVSFVQQDLSSVMPPGPFDLILCRNLAFTYFDEALQRNIAALLVQRLVPGGCLVVGAHERLPEGVADIAPWPGKPGFYRRVSVEQDIEGAGWGGGADIKG
jgi:chemotaxis protein methyltransferase CheR